MKPQEVANTAWALATLRFFPGASLLDALLAQAGWAGLAGAGLECFRLAAGGAAWKRPLSSCVGYPPCAEYHLHSFKSQELGMLSWAMARLAYMPAATLVASMLPLAAEWRHPAVQVRGWQPSPRAPGAAAAAAGTVAAADLVAVRSSCPSPR